MRALRLPAALCVALSLVTVIASGTAAAADSPSSNVCGTSPLGAGDSIEMTAIGGEAKYSLQNPIPNGAKSINAGWLTEQLLMQPNASAPAQPTPDLKPFPFTLGFCGPDPNDPSKPLTKYFVFGSKLDELASAEKIVINFVSNEAGKFERYLELTWKADDKPETKPTMKRYKVTVNSGVPDYANDSRYKLWAYTGYTYLRSQNDFKDSFAELLLRFETRWSDARIALKHNHPDIYAEAARTGHRCDSFDEDKWQKKKCLLCRIFGSLIGPQPTDSAAKPKKPNFPDDCPAATFGIMRIYGEAGITGTTATAAGSTPSNTTIGGTTEGFAGSTGIGFGRTRLVTAIRPTDTRAFSYLFVPRLGINSIPAATDANGKPLTDDKGKLISPAFTAFDYSASFRIENEPILLDDTLQAGNFEGAYSEIGVGESQQFTHKRFPRLRFDGLLPVPGGSDIFRFAIRLQVDAPLPFSNRKTYTVDKITTDNMGNEIRISALFNIDLLALGKRIAGNK
jgi:hypothetical protein